MERGFSWYKWTGRDCISAAMHKDPDGRDSIARNRLQVHPGRLMGYRLPTKSVMIEASCMLSNVTIMQDVEYRRIRQRELCIKEPNFRTHSLS